MKKQSEKFDSILKKVVQHMVDTELYGWPPQCTAFYFAEKGVDKPCTVYSSKNDNEQLWYLTIYKANPNTGVGSTLSSTNIFLARMNKVGNVSGANHHFVSDEHRISNYIVGYPFQYTYLVDTEMTLYLGGRKTSGSTSTTPLIVSGVYCP